MQIKFKPLVLPKIVEQIITYILCIIFSPVLLILVILILIDNFWEKNFKPSKNLHTWFAWYPVQFNDDWDEENYGKWVWLENIKRQREYDWVYHFPMDKENA